jgi:photosystem II stability/assembly factor-like uncharacterized protein
MMHSTALRAPAHALILLLTAWSLLMTGCGQPGSDAYGGAQNHGHDLLALRGSAHTLLLATHYGLYRTTNSGHSWTEVAGDSGQPMDGLMLFRLAQSPVDPRRVYVLAIPRTGRRSDARAAPGLYTSTDFGRTWHLATDETALPTQTIFTIGAGSGSAGQVYALIPALAEHGLYTTADGGAHWAALRALPDAHPTGVTGDANHAGRILLWSSSTGFYTSDDAGVSWHQAVDIQGGIFAISVAGPTIYANGDAGTYVSTDDGAHFTLVDANDTFAAVVACPAAPSHAYALTGTAVYATTDAGKTWQQTAHTPSHPGGITVDPADPAVAYIDSSYPIGVAATSDSGQHWTTVLP